MPVSVRRATWLDAGLLAALSAEVQTLHAAALPGWFKPPDPQSFSLVMAGLAADPSNLLLVAEIDGAPAGYVHARLTWHADTPWRWGYAMLYVHQIGVSAAHRRRGVGTALVAAVRAEAASRNVALLGLDVWSFNADARAFFQSQGFAPYNERLVHVLAK